MVFAVRCPARRCRKYMLVEAADRGTVVTCLICRTPIKVPAEPEPEPELEVLDADPAGLPPAKPLPPA
jgi:hypothetical protein